MVVIIMNLPPTDDTKREGVGSFSYPPATSVGFGVQQSQGTQLVSSSTTQQQSAPDGMSPTAAASMMVGGEPSALELIAISRAHSTATAAASAASQSQAATTFASNNNKNKKPPPKKNVPIIQVRDTSRDNKQRMKKYNNFNIFFMLERQLLLQSRGGGIDAVNNPIDTSDSHIIKHKPLNLPPLPRRYNHLPLTSNWFLELLAGQKKKRAHRKSHGLIPFKELAQTVAKNYKDIDDETQSFVNEVAERLGWHAEEIEAIHDKERKEEEEKERAEKKASGVMDASSSDTALGNSGMKRKDPAPPVIGPNTMGGIRRTTEELSADEADTVQQLMGMKSSSPSSRGLMMNNIDTRTAAVGLGPYPRAAQTQGTQVTDYETERLRLELARAINSRQESERRIQSLSSQMQAHRRALIASQNTLTPEYLAMLARGSGSPSHGPRALPSGLNAASVEQALLREAQLRGLVLEPDRSGPPPATSASTGTSRGEVRLNKRARYEQMMARSNEEKNDDDKPLVGGNRTNPQSGIGTAFYRDLYAKLAASTHPSPPTVVSQASSSLDSLTALLARDPALASLITRDPSASPFLIEHLSRGRGGNNATASYQYLPQEYPSHAAASAGLFSGQSYESLLSQLEAQRALSTSAASPPTNNPNPSLLEMLNQASRRSDGLSYHDIMEVWHQRNKKSDAEEGKKEEGEQKEEEEEEESKK